MSGAKHSPAPWRRRKGPFGCIVVGPAILEHPGRDSRFLEEKLAQRDADAALIGAAPAMLAALRGIIEQMEGIGVPDWRGAEGLCLANARAAIAEAEGRS